MLELFCASHGWTYEVKADLGSGMTYRKKGLLRLLNMLIDTEIKRLVVTHTGIVFSASVLNWYLPSAKCKTLK